MNDGHLLTAAYSFVSVLADALPLGWRAGKRVVGTEYVMLELVRRSELSVDRLGPLLPHLRTRADRLFPYHSDGGLPEASIADAEPSDYIARESESILREARWQARKRNRSLTPDVSEWTDGIRAAVRAALLSANSLGVTRAHGWHLSVGILADPANRAHRLLDQFDLDIELIDEEARSEDRLRLEGHPLSQSLTDLQAVGALTIRQPLVLRGLAPLIRLRSRRWFGPIIFALRQESIRQEVRRGHPQIDQTTLLTAVFALDTGLRAAGHGLKENLRPGNRAVAVLSKYGVTHRAVALRAAGVPYLKKPADQSRRWRVGDVDPPFGTDATAALDLAHRYATQLGHSWAGTMHVLAALLADSEGTASQLLISMGVDIGALGEEIARDLGDTGQGALRDHCGTPDPGDPTGPGRGR